MPKLKRSTHFAPDMLGLVGRRGEHQDKDRARLQPVHDSLGPLRARPDIARSYPACNTRGFQVPANLLGGAPVLTGVANENLRHRKPRLYRGRQSIGDSFPAGYGVRRNRHLEARSVYPGLLTRLRPSQPFAPQIALFAVSPIRPYRYAFFRRKRWSTE